MKINALLLIILFSFNYNINIPRSKMNDDIPKTINEIDQFTDSLLRGKNVKYAKINLDKEFENKLALKKLKNSDPNMQDMKSFEILVCLSKNLISEEDAVKAFDNLNESYRLNYLRGIAAYPTNPDISEYNIVLSYLRNLKGKESIFLKDFNDEFLDLKLKKKYYPEEFDDDLLEFYSRKKNQFTRFDWTNLYSLLIEEQTQSTIIIASEIITQEKSSPAYQNLGVDRLIKIYNSLYPDDPVDRIYSLLNYSKEEIDERFLLPKDENPDIYGGYVETFDSINRTLNLPLKKRIIGNKNELNVINIPDFETGWFINYATEMKIGFCFYVVDCDEYFPIPYDRDFEEYCAKVYELLDIKVKFLYDYDLIYENDKPVKEAYTLVLQYVDKQYQLSFEYDMGCRNADLFIAINNKLLQDLKIPYRFLKLDETNYILTNDKSIPNIIKLYRKYWF